MEIKGEIKGDINVLTVQDFSRKDIASFGSLFFTTGEEKRRKERKGGEREDGVN
jgi:hypothetical protein